MGFTTKLAARWEKSNSLLCVGLDPDLGKMPQYVAQGPEPLFTFNKAIIDATAELVCMFKPNSAMYEAQGSLGIEQLQKTCAYIAQEYPDIPVLLDYKRGDIGNTNTYYAQFAFDYLGVDAVTISPYMGKEANEAFLAYQDKGIFVLCRTSNPGAGELQDLVVDGEKLYQLVARHVMTRWDNYHNCALVVGSPYPAELATLRQNLGDEVLFLVPGAGTQAGSIEQTVRAGINSEGVGMIVNSSREVIYASSGEDFAEAARTTATRLRDEINKYR
jgi:orotidine-5'-phosphate decarboxylase